MYVFDIGHTHTHTLDIKTFTFLLPGAIMRRGERPFQPSAFFGTFCDRSHVLDDSLHKNVTVSLLAERENFWFWSRCSLSRYCFRHFDIRFHAYTKTHITFKVAGFRRSIFGTKLSNGSCCSSVALRARAVRAPFRHNALVGGPRGRRGQLAADRGRGPATVHS